MHVRGPKPRPWVAHYRGGPSSTSPPCGRLCAHVSCVNSVCRWEVTLFPISSPSGSHQLQNTIDCRVFEMPSALLQNSIWKLSSVSIDRSPCTAVSAQQHGGGSRRITISSCKSKALLPSLST